MCFERLIIDLLILPMLESLLGYRKDQIPGPSSLRSSDEARNFFLFFLETHKKIAAMIS